MVMSKMPPVDRKQILSEACKVHEKLKPGSANIYAKKKEVNVPKNWGK